MWKIKVKASCVNCELRTVAAWIIKKLHTGNAYKPSRRGDRLSFQYMIITKVTIIRNTAQTTPSITDSRLMSDEDFSSPADATDR